MTEYDFSNFSDFGTGDFLEEEKPSQQQSQTIAVVDADDAVREYLASLVSEPTQASTASEIEAAVGTTPTVVILGPSCAQSSELAIIEGWSTRLPSVVSILVVAELSTELLHKALRIGIKDVLTAPIESEALNDAVQRVAQGLKQESTPSIVPQLSPQIPEGEDSDSNEDGRVISIFSTKGGSGKSITASNLALLLAESSPKPVVLIDGHLQFGDMEVMLKIQSQHTVVDAVENLEHADAGYIKGLMAVHEASGLLVLPAPREPTFADNIAPEQMQRLIGLCRQFAGHIVVDLPAIFNEMVISILENSSDIVLVAGLDIPNIKNVKIGLRTLSMLGISEERIHLVLNRADSKVKLDVSEVERTLGVGATTRVPSDVVVPISVNKGSPVVLSASKSGPARAFRELAAQFVSGLEAQTAASSGRRKFFG